MKIRWLDLSACPVLVENEVYKHTSDDDDDNDVDVHGDNDDDNYDTVKGSTKRMST